MLFPCIIQTYYKREKFKCINIWWIKEYMGAGWKDVVCDVIAMWTRDYPPPWLNTWVVPQYMSHFSINNDSLYVNFSRLICLKNEKNDERMHGCVLNGWHGWCVCDGPKTWLIVHNTSDFSINNNRIYGVKYLWLNFSRLICLNNYKRMKECIGACWKDDMVDGNAENNYWCEFLSNECVLYTEVLFNEIHRRGLPNYCKRRGAGNYVPRGCLRPPYAESSAVGRNAKFNEVIKRVIIVFKIIFFNGLCRRRVGNWGCSGLHVCVLLLHVVSIWMNQFLR